MTAPAPSAVQAPRPLHIRCTIESTAYSMCKYTPGQSFDIIDGRLASTPPDGICLYIFNNLVGLLLTRLNDPDVEEWVRSGPATTCSDGPERTIVRLSLVEDAAARSPATASARILRTRATRARTGGGSCA